MHCEHFQSQIDELIDGELAEMAAQRLLTHLHGCAECRQEYEQRLALDGRLRSTLGAFAELAAARDGATSWNAPSAHSSRPGAAQGSPHGSGQPLGAMVAAAILLALSLGGWWWAWRPTPGPQRPHTILRLTRSTGPIEVAAADNSASWRPLAPGVWPVPAAGAQLRTRANALGELLLNDQTTLRLAPETEVTLDGAHRAALRRGKMWIRTAHSPLELSLPTAGSVVDLTESSAETVPDPGVDASTQPAPQRNNSATPATIYAFTCPSHSTLQCEVGDDSTSCLALAPVALQLAGDAPAQQLGMHDELRWPRSSNPNNWAIFACEADSPVSHPAYPLTWQLPLLATDVHDQDLLTLLVGMLPEETRLSAKAMAGATKLDFFYDAEIRALGARGALPLLAFVRSAESQSTPERRLRAMRLGCESADRSAEGYLSVLAKDADPRVAELALQTLQRVEQ